MVGSSNRRRLNGSMGSLTLLDESSAGLATEVVSSGLDKFIRTTDGGKVVLRQISVYAMLPYALLGFAVGYVVRGMK